MNIAVRTNETPAERPGDSPEQIDLPGFKLSTSCDSDEPEQETGPEPTQAVDPGHFDWDSDDSVCVVEQPAVATYRNRYSHVVIRCRAPDPYDEDGFVHITTPDALKLLIAALQRELKAW